MRRTGPETAVDLAAHECANSVHGLCIIGGGACLVALGRGCGYFETAVLPLHPEMQYAAGPPPGEARVRCRRCGDAFLAGSHRSKWCPECAREVRREQTRRRVARHRAGVASEGRSVTR